VILHQQKGNETDDGEKKIMGGYAAARTWKPREEEE